MMKSYVANFFNFVENLIADNAVNKKAVSFSEKALNPLQLFCALIKIKAKDLHLSQESLSQCETLVSSSLRRDKITALHEPDFMNVIIGYVADWSHSSCKPSFLVEGDFSNLKGCNNAIGKAHTNKIMRIITLMYQGALEKINPNLCYGIRHGGDEFRFVLANANAADIAQAVAQVQNDITTFIKELGLDKLEHSKYPNDPVRRGVGAEVACVRLTNSSTPETVQLTLDADIERKKITSGKSRLSHKDSIRPELRKPDSFTPQECIAIGKKCERYLEKYPYREDSIAFPFAHFPHKGNSDPALNRLEQTKQLSKTLSLNPQQETFLVQVLQTFYENNDAITTMRRPYDFIPLVSSRLGQQGFVIKAEAINFSGLNKGCGHEGTNKIFAKMAHILSATFEKENISVIWLNRGGGNIAGICFDRSNMDTVGACISACSAAINDNIACQDINVFQSNVPYQERHSKAKLYNMPNPRGGTSGIGFLIAIDSTENFHRHEDLLSSLDMQIEKSATLPKRVAIHARS